MIHPTEPMILSLPSSFSICARSFGVMYATDGDSSSLFPDDCVKTDVSKTIAEPERQREVDLQIRRTDSALEQFKQYGGLKETIVEGQEVRYHETAPVYKGILQSHRTLSVEYETVEGWVHLRADATAKEGEVADLSYAWLAIEAMIKHHSVD